MAGADKDWNAKLILIKREAVEGVDSAPGTAADAFKVLNFVPQFMDADAKVRQIEKAFFGADPVAMANFKRGATFDMEIHGSGDASGVTPPPWMQMIQFCGYGEPVIGAASVAINPITRGIPSASLWLYIDDLLLKAFGARGGVGFTFEDDDYPRLSFNMLGRPPELLADQQIPPAIVPAGYITPEIASTEVSSFLYGNYAHPLRRWTMSDNAQLSLKSYINPQDRIKYGNRSWSGEIVIKIGDLNVANPFGNIRAGTTLPAKAIHGATAGNIVEINAPALQVTGNVTLSEEDGDTIGTFPVTAIPVNGNDEVSFITR
jgi:hypothetical protein